MFDSKKKHAAEEQAQMWKKLNRKKKMNTLIENFKGDLFFNSINKYSCFSYFNDSFGHY